MEGGRRHHRVLCDGGSYGCSVSLLLASVERVLDSVREAIFEAFAKAFSLALRLWWHVELIVRC